MGCREAEAAESRVRFLREGAEVCGFSCAATSCQTPSFHTKQPHLAVFLLNTTHRLPVCSPGDSLACPEPPPAVGSSCAELPDERISHCPMAPQGLLSLSPKEGSGAGRVTEEQAAPQGSPSPTLSASRSNPPRGNAIPWEHSRLQACQKLLHSPSKGQKDILCK